MYEIRINGRTIATVDGVEIAHEVYKKACEIADMTGESVSLARVEKGQIIIATYE